ncbi:MAG: hypothetical protein A2189_02710 [Paenibacillus sp. RIFOXYA1_FULL_44_5]|nr:MAG: hypothetical protein A2189_02710 [Paenibacillus sp. RIFOXYA1_FULL_44_5]
MGNLFAVLFSPAASFEKLKEKGGWTIPAVVLSIISLITVWLELPLIQELANKALEQKKVDPQLQHITQTVTTYTGYVGALFGLAASFFIGGLLLYLVNMFIRGEAKYMQLVKVSMYAGFPGIIGSLISAILIRATHPTDIKDVMISAGAFLSQKNGFLFNVLNLFNPFSIWGLVLMIVGTSVMARKPRSSAAVWIIAGWIIIGLIGASLGGLANTGA